MNFTSQRLHLERLMRMVDFNNKWYRETCLEHGFNPDNVLSQSAVEVAKQCAINMKMYMDNKKHYESEELLMKFDEQINRLNNERIEFMLYALTYAEMMDEMGKGFDTFAKRYLDKREQAQKQGNEIVDDAPLASSEVKKRVAARWEQAMKKMEG